MTFYNILYSNNILLFIIRCRVIRLPPRKLPIFEANKNKYMKKVINKCNYLRKYFLGHLAEKPQLKNIVASCSHFKLNQKKLVLTFSFVE